MGRRIGVGTERRGTGFGPRQGRAVFCSRSEQCLPEDGSDLMDARIQEWIFWKIGQPFFEGAFGVLADGDGARRSSGRHAKRFRCRARSSPSSWESTRGLWSAGSRAGASPMNRPLSSSGSSGNILTRFSGSNPSAFQRSRRASFATKTTQPDTAGIIGDVSGPRDLSCRAA